MQTCRDCIHVHYIVPAPYSSSNYGWGCLKTGDHAIKVCRHFEAQEPEQAQYSTIEQLANLIPVANELKLYDAADYLQALVDNQKANER